jgi:2'-5' RNA ligase
LRVFFALCPDAATRTCIANAAAALRLTGGARPVPRDNFHLTLAFVGEVPSSGLAVLQQIGRNQRASGCTIQLDAYEHWPEPRVVVAAAREPPPALIDLRSALRHDLALQPEALDSNQLRPQWRAHVTLARKVVQAPVLQAMSAICWSARSFSLIRSDTSGAHSVYTVVDTWPLLDETPKP